MSQPSCSLSDTFVVHFVVTSACRRCLSSSLIVLQSSASGRAGCSQICFKLEYLSHHKQIEHIVCASFVDSVLKQIRECSHIFSTSRAEEELTWKRTMTCISNLHLHNLFCSFCTWHLLHGSLMDSKEKWKRSQQWGPQDGEDPLGDP